MKFPLGHDFIPRSSLLPAGVSQLLTSRAVWGALSPSCASCTSWTWTCCCSSKCSPVSHGNWQTTETWRDKWRHQKCTKIEHLCLLTILVCQLLMSYLIFGKQLSWSKREKEEFFSFLRKAVTGLYLQPSHWHKWLKYGHVNYKWHKKLETGSSITISLCMITVIQCFILLSNVTFHLKRKHHYLQFLVTVTWLWNFHLREWSALFCF